MTAAHVAAACYGLGCIAYILLAIMVGARSMHSARGRLLIVAATATALWEFSGVGVALWPSRLWVFGHFLADGARFAAWIAFLLALMPALQIPGRAIPLTRGRRAALGIGCLVVLWTLIAGVAAYRDDLRVALGAYAVVLGAFAVVSVAGLSLCEQLFRGATEAGRWAAKPLCLGLGAAYAFDLFMFSDALLLKELDLQIWSVRGLAHAFAIPFLLLSAARNREWTIDVSVSRSVVFGSTTLLLSGLYMLAVAGAGYFVRFFGGDWGTAVQVTFLFGALLVLAFLFFSGTVRARIKVFINKNFFSYRYDYREEWLKFTSVLAGHNDSGDIVTRAIQALADLVESPAGAQWWRTSQGEFRVAGTWNWAVEGEVTEPPDGSLAAFLEQTNWVVSLPEYRRDPGRYAGLTLPDWLLEMDSAWIVIPLPTGSALGGFVVLSRPRAQVDLNWEVLDLLKTAARQAATVIAQVRATEALVEAKQFSAFNRMSAFVVHDLKNLVAQLSLMLRNAERHGNNPEFQADMRATIEHVVERMNRLLLQLRSGTVPITKPASVDVGTVIASIRAAWARQGREVGTTSVPDLWAMAHEDRLERVIGHLVQNAFDAMDGKGAVQVRAEKEEGFVVIEVQDQGKGMTPEFVRDELFKPFRSTKSTGMGIGAFESQQYVTELGGRITVDSHPDRGTRFRVYLPARTRDVGSLPNEEAAA
ncbi:MAG: PEP-CTERM system histidine kinase PrsK [Betaproteobacteria bacterium]|nr:PEP-CTERM system histidine kinase PrsK [Betaproteobacteria bacterium]